MAEFPSYLNAARAQEEYEGRIINNFGGGQVFDERFLFQPDVRAEEFEIFGVNPFADIALANDDRAGILKDGVPGDMVKVIVGIDDELDRKFRDLSNLRQELAGSFWILEGIDNRYSIVTYDEPGVGACVAFRGSDGRPHIVC
jgi:hypothetical protein